MPGRTDRPGGSPADRPPADRSKADRPSADRPPADQRAQGSGADGSQDALRRRLANLPANHPSSPWYRERRRERAARQDQPDNDQDQSTAGERGQAAGAAGREMTGEAAMGAARVARGADKRSGRRDEDARDSKPRGNEDLWRLAASQQAASEARRRARGGGTPGAPAARGESYRPWFADATEGEPWLSAEETGEPWFTQEDQ
jgi:hypothetical protein